MLPEFLSKLCGELSIPFVPKLNEKKGYVFRLKPDVEVICKNLEPGISFAANITPCPAGKREDLFIFLMQANLLGQGTGNTRIGLDENEKVLTLSLGLPYEMNYKAFKETLEDFVNYLIYWREEIAKFGKEKQSIL